MNQKNDTPSADVTPPEPPRRDLEDGLRFVHVMGMQTKVDLLDVTTRVYTLVEELVANGTLDLRAFDARREKVRVRETDRAVKQANVAVSETVDKYAIPDGAVPKPDCKALFPICKARCCHLTFPLSFQDLDEGVVRWNYGQPYIIRHTEEHRCVHSCTKTGACKVYEQRPAICRTYDCRHDERIWLDFDNKVPAPMSAILGPAADPKMPDGDGD